ncbi:precorrin-6y C5,15-methyltransferase (decarboxylating) subunit CbiE [Actinobacteria bacterium YIM 96077]|uniref:Cobalamin biosynthesis bifunctional protein CbiET n=1 Tax=Phytoactinopolyspora halophila TaxID=1981511 RepID=A0A329QPY1_9ACTN|nr:precorrin-6y C5,15-methyltransferase (decarboxylating) subunit CbiE [Actinobacteria bacterium YIM 96077]RAW14226.1 cobalamin biosynthesis bifunctional protein CbiET [Phytoactinopolyspora halophila]
MGIGADGWPGLTDHAREIVERADVLVGGQRHLDMVPRDDVTKVSWPKPLRDGLPRLFATHEGRRRVVLASGDPLVSGVGTTLIELFGSDAVRIVPAVSSVALARARLGWAADRTEVISVVGREVRRIARALAPAQLLLILSSDESTPALVASLLTEHGYGASRVWVLENLGGADERCVKGTARDWGHPEAARLNVVAVECEPDPGTWPLATVPGLPDEAFEHDGQLTKRDMRASCLARLNPLPGQLLWDVGAGSGSIAIEWMRAHPSNRAVAVEPRTERAGRVTRNAQRLGVPGLRVVEASAPRAFTELDETDRAPDAVFVGGGVSTPGLIDECWTALRPGGRIVAHAVTLESEAALVRAHAAYGGELVRHSLERAAPLGGLTGWEPARAVTQWNASKENR